MKPLLPLKLGSNCTILNVFQYNQWRHQNEEKENVLFIVYKDENGIKRAKSIPSPKMEIGFTKPESRKEWRMCRAYVPIEKVYLEEVDARKVVPRVVKELKECHDDRSKSLLDIYNNALASGEYKAKKEVLKSQHLFMGDIPVEDSYRIHLALQYNLNHNHIVNKSFLDIENDIAGLSSSELADHMAPTTAVTIIFDYDCVKSPVKGGGKPQVFTFLLRDHHKYPQQVYFEEHLDEFIKQCHDEYDNITIVRKGKKMTAPNTVADYHIKFYDHEEDLLIAVFKLLNHIRPDTCAVWNIAYDLPQMKGRMDHMGLDSVAIMSDPAFPRTCQFLEFNIDTRPGIEFADRKTHIKMTSTIDYVDQMQTYAQIRKGQKSYGSNKLDNIASLELGIKKRVFPEGVNITNAPVKAWWEYILYNINDVWLQVIIDRYTNDMITLIVDSNQTACAIENLTKQTRYQKQIYYLNYLRKGFIAGCNKNNRYVEGFTDDKADERREAIETKKLRRLLDADNDDIGKKLEESEVGEYSDFLDSEDDPDVQKTLAITDIYSDSPDRPFRLKGGLVGNPNLNDENGIELVEGVPSKHVFRNAVDFDYKALYPYVKYTRSVTGPTQIGRLIIPHRVSPKQNPLDTPGYIPGAEFISDYIAQDWLWFGNVWFNLPSVEDAEKELGL